MAENDVAIIGGGISGLVAALTLRTEYPGASILILEASDALGGKLRTEKVAGAQVEAGPDSFLARASDATDLCRELNLEGELVTPAVFGGLVWSERGIHRIPKGTLMGLPTSAQAVLRAAPLSPRGKARALGDLFLPGRLKGNDISVGELVRRRFGPEVLERMVDPILAGTRAGEADSISLRAALPQVDQAARRHRSLMAGLRAERGPGDGPPPFFAPRSGMQTIVDALVKRLADVRTETANPVTRIAAGKRGGYLIHTSSGARHEAEAVVLAVPSGPASKMLAELNGAAAAGLGRLKHASVAVVTLVLERDSIRTPHGTSGFLVPGSADRLLSAGTWYSRKWPHTTPDDLEVVRLFIGRAGRHPALDSSDDGLIHGTARELGDLLGAPVRPLEGRVTRWDDGLPQYEVGHLGRISRIEGALDKHSGIVLAGADYRGSGIPDCIHQGRNAARRVAAWL